MVTPHVTEIVPPWRQQQMAHRLQPGARHPGGSSAKASSATRTSRASGERPRRSSPTSGLAQ